MTKLTLLLAACAASRPATISSDPAYERQDWATCATENLAAARDGKRAAEAFYDAACCQARGGQPDAAIDSLLRAIDAGFSELLAMTVDPDLRSLHGHDRFPEVIDRLERSPHRAGINLELERIYVEDQQDRGDAMPEPKVLMERDQARRERVAAIVDTGGARIAIDYLHAAFVFQHGMVLADYQRAHELALRAVELGHEGAKWIAAASKDRWLMNSGKPQWYGTQFRHDGKQWTLYQVDPSITDAERARWNVPPIASARKKVEALNRQPPPR